MNLWQIYLEQKQPASYKWTHYTPIYEKHFAQWKDKSLFLLEIGVHQGGSLHMWSKYFGPLATIVGVDIDVECKKYEKNNVYVRIGDQSDKHFLQSIIDEFGVPDIVLDDGSHMQEDIYKTFEFLYPKLGKNSMYVVEDTHTCYWKKYNGGLNDPNSFLNRSKEYTDQLNIEHTKGELQPNDLLKGTFSISYYNSIVIFEKQTPYAVAPLWSGDSYL